MPDATPRPNRVSTSESSCSPSEVGDTSPPTTSKLETWLGISVPVAAKIVYQASRRLYRQQHDAEDLTQEVMTRVLRVSAKEGTKRPHTPKAWLETMTINVFRSEWRHAQTLKCGSGEIPKYLDEDIADGAPGTEESALRNIEHSKLRRAISTLTEYQKQLIIDHYYEERTLQAMSILRGNIPKTTLKSQLDATMRVLRRTMKSESETR